MHAEHCRYSWKEKPSKYGLERRNAEGNVSREVGAEMKAAEMARRKRKREAEE